MQRVMIHVTVVLPVAIVDGLQDPWIQCNAVKPWMQCHARWHFCCFETLLEHLSCIYISLSHC